jgi:23S rRNA (uracil1939-C5)-methyltransferase
MKKNELYPAEITGYTSEGLGVCRIEGRAVFVKGAIAGEQCLVRILKVGKTAVYGKLEQLTKPSPHRLAPACPYFGKCGGCDFHHMDYDEELRLKAQRVTDALNRLGGCQFDVVPILGAETTRNYRNKAQYPVALGPDGPQAGFFRAHSHQVIPVDRCAIQSAEADAAKAAVVDWMRANHVPAYDETTHRGLVRHIYVRTGAETGQLLLCIVANGDSLPKVRDLIDRVQMAAPSLTTVVLSVHKKPGNAVLGQEFHTLFGPGYIEDVLCGLTFRLSPRSFYQVNHDQAQRLYELAIDAAGLTGAETVLDLYCGTGTITLAMAGRAGQVIGVEIIPQAIDDANDNARRNRIGNARFLCADAGEAAARLAAEGTHPDVVVVDPPRKGLSADVIPALAQMAPQRIVYVSCDPATLARDIARLREVGYEAQWAKAVDLFPRCAHVETVCLLSKLNNATYRGRLEHGRT